MSISVRIHRIEWNWIANIEDVTWPSSTLSNSSRVQIMQMRNGLGKTTSLYLMQSLFTGKPPDSTTFGRARYKGPQKSLRGSKKSKFSMELSIDGDSWILGMHLDPESERCDFFTVNPRSGNEKGWKPPRKFRSAFEGKNEFVQLFLFDTQRAGAMTESLPSKAVDTAIMEISNLSNVKELVDVRIDDVYQARIDEMDVNDSTSVLARTKNAIKHLTRIRENLLLTEQELEEERDGEGGFKEQLIAVNKALDDLKDKSKIKGKIKQAETKIKASKKEIVRMTKQLYSLYLDPANLPSPIWSGVQDYFQQMEELRIPDVIVKEVIDKIQDTGICICGTELGPDHHEHLEEFKKNRASRDVVQEIFHIKNGVSERQCGEDDIESKISELKIAKDSLDELKDHRRQLYRSMGEDTASRIDDLEDSKFELKRNINDIGHLLEELRETDSQAVKRISGRAYTRAGQLSQNESDYTECMNLHTIERGLEMFRRKEGDALGVKTYRMAYESIRDSLERALGFVMEDLKEELLVRTNEYLPRLQTQGMMVRDFEDGITLIDRNRVVQKGANTGGELSTQYSFLMALRTLGEIDIPMVIDNPTKGLESRALQAFQEELPAMFDQTLMLTYPPEKDQLAMLLGEESHLSTLNRKDEVASGANERGEEPIGKVILNEDVNWFLNYDPPVPRARPKEVMP